MSLIFGDGFMSTVPYSEFIKNYKKWQHDCRVELKQLGHVFHWSQVEICTDGSIRFKGEFYCTSANYVTPWKNSKWYVE